MTKEQMRQILTTLSCWRNDPNLFQSEMAPVHYIHYTSFAGFKAMFEPYAENGEQYIRIFPSQIQYLNDYQEYKEGVKVVGNIPVGIDNNIFAVCFCGEEDLLSQWKYYGKNSGIAIEFDFNNNNPCRYKWWDDIDEKVSDKSDEFLMRPYPVLYNDHDGEFKKLYDNFKLSHSEDLLKNIYIPFCKNKSFHEEVESRLIFYPISEDDRTTKIKYRVTEDKIIPQFECSVSYYENNPLRVIPIKNIMIGPGPNQILLFNAVIKMIEKNECKLLFYDDEEIKKIAGTQAVLSVKQIPGKLYKAINKSGKEYVTYKTSSEITVQLSATPFRP